MTHTENTLRKEYRLPNITTLEDLEGRDGKAMSFGEYILVAGYYYEYKQPCWYGAIYEYSTEERSCEEDVRLVAISTKKFEDNGHAIEWAMRKAYDLKETKKKKSKMMYFTFQYEKDGETYTTGSYGRTPDEALQHERFWWPELPEDDKLTLVKAEPLSWMNEEEDENPYEEETILRQIYADKELAKEKVARCDACDSDKEWMNEMIDSEDPKKYMFADTAVRDWLRYAWKEC